MNTTILALLGLFMIICFMALIMTKKMSPFTSLIIIPVIFGVLAGYGFLNTLSYAMDGIKSVASTFAMMLFAILYFGILLQAGLFDPMVDVVVRWVKGDPLKVLVGTAIISSLAPDMINVVMMVIGAGVLMGVLNGPANEAGEYASGMSNAIAVALTGLFPESLGRYFSIIIAIISAPGTYLLNNDAFYYGVLPPLAATAEAYGFTSLQIGFASLMGQAFHFLSPLVPFIYLLMDKTEITLAQYQGYIFKWCIGIFVSFMVVGFLTGYLAIL